MEYQPNPDKMCGRCYDEVEKVLPANCHHKPEQMNIGMHHCPDCGAMVLGLMTHPPLCQVCHDRMHPGFDFHADGQKYVEPVS